MKSVSSAKVPSQKITLSLPHALIERLNTQIPAHQRSRFIARILEDYLALAEQTETLAETFGCWPDEDHPDLVTGEDIDAWLAALRGEW